jgi:hypothetical protein
MRFSLSLALVLIAGCKAGSMTTPPNGVDAASQPDAPGVPPGDTGFEIVSKDAMLMPGTQVTYCYHFHTPNTAEVAVNKWVSDMTPGSHHAILFMMPGGSDVPDGTLDTAQCGASTTAAWTYATQTEHNEMDLPADDGTGKPLAQKIPANTAAVLQLHYVNASDNVLMAHIDLKAYGLAAGTPYTQTDPYVTYQYQINIAAGATGVVVPGSCAVPTGAKFWLLTTHTHKQGVDTKIMDGSNMLFESADWEHPGAVTYMTPDKFYTFSGPLKWSCTYDNNAPPPYCDTAGSPQDTCSNADRPVAQGQSAISNEMCMASGYYFPAQGPKIMVALGPNSCMSF